MADTEKPKHRAGFCALLGLPNVGKSTLLNRLLGMRLVAVSPKPQTTRNRIVGVVNVAANPDSVPAGAQIVFVDTPGVQTGGTALRRYMRDQALAAAGDGDVAVHMIDASHSKQVAPSLLRDAEAKALERAVSTARAAGKPLLLAINKVDRIGDKGQLLPILEAYGALGIYDEMIPISAQTGDGVEHLTAAVASRLPEGPPLYPEEMVTDRAERFLAGELVREQLFRQLGQELPYATAVEIEAFEERQDKGDVIIAAAIHVERESQKPIVIGKGGQRIKAVGAAARAAVSELLGCPVHVRLHVKVSPKWSDSQRALRDLGYE